MSVSRAFREIIVCHVFGAKKKSQFSLPKNNFGHLWHQISLSPPHVWVFASNWNDPTTVEMSGCKMCVLQALKYELLSIT